LLLKLLERAFVGDGAFGVEVMDVDFHAGTASAATRSPYLPQAWFSKG
jgi:hypothetical protein